MIKDITIINSNQNAIHNQLRIGNIGRSSFFAQSLKRVTNFLTSFFLLPGLSNVPSSHVNARIDPKKNFLLRRSQLIAEKKCENKIVSLYRLYNGVCAVHEVFFSEAQDEKLRAVSTDEMIKIFGANILKWV